MTNSKVQWAETQLQNSCEYEKIVPCQNHLGQMKNTCKHNTNSPKKTCSNQNTTHFMRNDVPHPKWNVSGSASSTTTTERIGTNQKVTATSMNGDFQHSTSFAERPGTVQFAIFHPYSSLKGCRDGMPEITKRIKPQLFQPRRKLTSLGSLDCIAIVQQSWPECERVLRISS